MAVWCIIEPPGTEPKRSEDKPLAMDIRILLAIEDPLLRTLLAERLLQEEGFVLVGAVGISADILESVSIAAPRVVILDLQWSDAAGIALLERLASQCPDVLTLALVAEEMEETQLLAAQHGARGVVAKTEGVAVLPAAIRAVSRGEVWFTRQISRRIFQEYHRLVRQQREQQHPLAALSAREREVLALVAEGLTNRAIAERLHMSIHTVKLHVQRILDKLQLRNRSEAAVFAVREGLVSALPRHLVSETKL